MNRVPPLIYESLPYLGVIAGFAWLVSASSIVAIIPGVMLIAPSLLIMKMRIQRRRKSGSSG